MDVKQLGKSPVDECFDTLAYLEATAIAFGIPAELLLDSDNVCSRCGKPFTEEEWDERHTDPADNLSDCHAKCCPKCKNERKGGKK